MRTAKQTPATLARGKIYTICALLFNVKTFYECLRKTLVTISIYTYKFKHISIEHQLP